MSQSSGTNVLLEVASLSMRTARKYVEPFAHRNSPKKFTQSQLMTCLVLRAYLKTTYRGIIEILETSEALRKRMGIERLTETRSATPKYFCRIDQDHHSAALVSSSVSRQPQRHANRYKESTNA